jgi:hypothetical protein
VIGASADRHYLASIFIMPHYIISDIPKYVLGASSPKGLQGYQRLFPVAFIPVRTARARTPIINFVNTCPYLLPRVYSVVMCAMLHITLEAAS